MLDRREEFSMRTTLSIKDDALAAAKELAEIRRQTVGEVISELARKGLRPRKTARRKRNGITLLPVQPRSRPVTPEHMTRLLDELV
jgi:hypothetical protein